MSARILPPDRSHVGTEQRHATSAGLDGLSTIDVVQAIARDQQDGINAVLGASAAIAAFIDAVAARTEQGGRLFYAGAGTSGRLGVLDASECPPTFGCEPDRIIGLIAGGDAALRRSSERREDERDGVAPELEAHSFGERDTLLAIAAGGTTPYALGAVECAKHRGGLTAFLTCASMECPQHCDHFLCLDTGAEVLTGSTRLKAGTATKVALNAITTGLFTRLGSVFENLMVDVRATNDKLVDRAIRTIRWCEPALSREEALAVLDAAGGSVKVAILMRRAHLSRDEATARLAAARGHVRAALA